MSSLNYDIKDKLKHLNVLEKIIAVNVVVFIVVLKKVDNSEPYFAMYISNTNYLQKYSKEYIDKINKEFDNKQPKLSMFDKLCMR